MHSNHHPKHQEIIGEKNCLVFNPLVSCEFYMQNENKFASIGVHLNFKRAKCAHVTINKLLGIFHMPVFVINNIKEKMFIEFWEYVYEF
jgi:hypothetical protein